VQQLEGYLDALKLAICEDLQQIVEECCADVGVESFLELSDTPNSYAGAAGQLVVVNALETGLEFQPEPDPPETFITKKMICLFKGNGTIGVTAMLIGNGQATMSGTTNANIQGTNTNFRTQFPRCSSTTGVGANTAAGFRTTNNMVYRGDVAGRGGFTLKARFATSTAIANQRLFVGLNGPVGAISGAVNASTLTNIIAMAMDAADANYSIMHNDGAGAATVIPLGAGFPKNTTAVYEFELTALPNASSVDYLVTNLETGATASGNISTNLPASNLFLELQTMIGPGATIAAAAIDHVYILLESGV
jgi:hypothetical protein